MGIRDRIREAQEKAKADREAAQAQRQEASRVAAESRSRAEAERGKVRQREILGAELADMDVSTAADAKTAIKLARLRKTEIAAEKRELAAELADVREEWRNRTAGRIRTVGMGRGTGGRIVRGAIQSKRRSERMSHAEVINEFSDRKQELDQALVYLDRVIVGLQRGEYADEPKPTKEGRSSTPKRSADDPAATLAKLADMRDQGLITPAEYDAKRAEVLARI